MPITFFLITQHPLPNYSRNFNRPEATASINLVSPENLTATAHNLITAKDARRHRSSWSRKRRKRKPGGNQDTNSPGGRNLRPHSSSDLIQLKATSPGSRIDTAIEPLLPPPRTYTPREMFTHSRMCRARRHGYRSRAREQAREKKMWRGHEARERERERESEREIVREKPITGFRCKMQGHLRRPSYIRNLLYLLVRTYETRQR